MDFTDAKPVAVTGAGRKKEDNPFTEVMSAIALKTQKDGDKDIPVAKSYVIDHTTNEDETNKLKNKITRQIREAANERNATGRVHFAPVKNSKTKTTVTFWTVKRQERPRTVAAPATPTA